MNKNWQRHTKFLSYMKNEHKKVVIGFILNRAIKELIKNLGGKNMKNKVLLLTLLLTVIFTSSIYAVDIMIDDEYVVFNEVTGKPFIDANGRTQVPLRATMEKYGATVTWDDVNKIAIVNYNGIIVEVPIGQNYIIKDGEKILNDTISLVKDNRTYLPIRIVLESFGSSVGWQNEFQRVIVNKYRDYSVTEELKEMGVEEWQSAMTYNDEEALREMFTGKYDINSPSSNGTYPLEYAITVNSTDMVKLMMELGANTQQVNSVGQSMVEIAKQKKHMNIVEILAPGTVVDISNSSNNIEWRLEGHEAVYPYKEYERKYIDGVKTNETRYTGTNWSKPLDSKKSINIYSVDFDINTADGVSPFIYWRNDSGKTIKYINFTAIPYNAVGDIVYSEIGGKSTAILSVTGPIDSFNNEIDIRGSYFKYLHYSMRPVYQDIYGDKEGMYYIEYWVSEYYYLTDQDFDNCYKKSSWRPVWYNSTVSSIKITSVEIIYMDGSTETINKPIILGN